MMFGFACDETPELMPAPITYAHRMAQRLTAVRKSGEVDFIRPDGKTQVTFEYDETGKIVRCDAVVLSTQHSPDVSLETVREAMFETVISPIMPQEYIDANTKIFINPTGRFVTGGPQGDSGLKFGIFLFL